MAQIVLASIFSVLVLGFAVHIVRSERTTRDLLHDSWSSYKSRFIQGDGRVVDRSASGTSTSEGQSYALLRAVWVDEHSTFDKILEWTVNNLNANERQDALFAWKWGHRDDGSWGVYDRATASDADEDIAYSLILAHQRWGDRKYLERAREMVRQIWNQETVLVNGKRYLIAGDRSRTETSARVNPSYFAPNAYRAFATVDRDHDWNLVIDSGYEMLEKVSNMSRVGLPPNWFNLDLVTGEFRLMDALVGQESDYSYDAIRVFWRVALDVRQSGDQRGRDYLAKHLDWLRRYWRLRKTLPAVISNDGIARVDFDSLEQYGALLPAFELVAPETATEIYQAKIQTAYRDGWWGNPDAYYTQNIVWFGLALYQDNFPLNPRGGSQIASQ